MTDPKLHRGARLRTLGEASERLALADHLADPERFLARQLKAGKIRGRKIGRSWLMTDADIEAAIDAFANHTNTAPAPAEPTPATVGMPSKGSLRRRRRAA